MLALCSMTLGQRMRQSVSVHTNLLLFSALAIYVYRDVWPLATYTKEPLDMNPPWFTWASVSLLAFSGLIIPLFTPHQYIPLDPNVCVDFRAFRKGTHDMSCF